MTEFIDEEQTRHNKLSALRERGIDPYPTKSDRTHTVADFLRDFITFEKNQASITLAGRITLVRRQGGLTFLQLTDDSGTVQVVIQKNTIGEEMYALFVDMADRADVIEATGHAFTTKRGEPSLGATGWKFLVKATKPLPEKWHGLKDKEERFRKRYLDMLMNNEVRDRFRMRARMIAEIRNFLDAEGFTEIEPPSLQPIYGGGFARPFTTHHNALDLDLYLPISNEMYLKRMVVGGFEKVYAITKVFRNEGVDQDHNPEFTMLEAQAAYQDYWYGMDLIERLFEQVALKVCGTTKLTYQGKPYSFKRPWHRRRMVDAIKDVTGVDVLAWSDLAQAKDAVRALGLKPTAEATLKTITTLGELIAFTFEEKVEETLEQPTIIYDYPVEVSPLAKKCPGDSRFAERFEYFAFGFEVGNNYSELNDPVDLKKRFIDEKKREDAGFEEAHQFDQDYLDAVAHGMPPNCGVAIGIDRMAMLLTDTASIKEVIIFPTMRPL